MCLAAQIAIKVSHLGEYLPVQGQDYKMCAEDQETTAAAPCEMGAVAEDEEDGNLTYAVLALPVGVAPTDCLEQDCAPYRLMAKGVQVGYLCYPILLCMMIVLSFIWAFRLSSYVPVCLLRDMT